MAALPAADPSAARGFLVEALQAHRQKPGLLVVSVPAPWLALEPLWATLPDEPAMLWDPPVAAGSRDGESCLGLGEVAVAAGDAPIQRRAPPGHPPAVLRWLGGRPFADAGGELPWSEFPGVAATL